MRRLAVVGGVLLVGCAARMPVAEPEPAANLTLDVTNASDVERSVSYEYELGAVGGGGEADVPACRLEPLLFGDLRGEYRILVDGEEVSQGAAPARGGAGAHLVIRVRIGPDGEVEVGQPFLAAEAPNVRAAVPGCGT